MKKITFTFMILLCLIAVKAQVPAGFSYQAVVRNSSGEIIANQTVKFQFTILRDSESGTPVYQETHSVPTNSFGLANLKVGMGTKVSGTFDPAAWGDNPHFLKVELDPAGGSIFTELGTTQLLAVPYAFHAKTVEDDTWGNQVVATDATLTGNGTNSSPLKIAQQSATNGQVLKWNGTTWLPGDASTGTTSLWQQNGSDIYFNAGKVGIDNQNPLYKLDVTGSVHVTEQLGIGMNPWSEAQLSVQGKYDKAVYFVNNGSSSTAYGLMSDAVGIGGSVRTGVIGYAQNGMENKGVEGHASSNGNYNYGIYGKADSGNNNYAVYGEVEEGTLNWAGYFLGNGFFAGNLGIGANPPTTKLDINGQIKIRGGSPGAGKVLTSDATGLASWETSGVLTLPFRGGSACEECEIFYIHNTEMGTAIKGDSYLGDGIVGVTKGTSSYSGVLGYAFNSSGVSRGVSGKTNSPTGYSGYFEGGRFYISGNVGIGNNSPANALSVSGQADISERLVIGGTTPAGRLLVANADGAGNSFKVGSSAGDNANIYFLADGLIFDCYRSSDSRRQPILLQPNGGRVGIGTKAPTQVLHVAGNAYKTEGGTSWATSSDLRLKTLLGNYDKGLNDIAALQPVRFIYNEGNPRQLSSNTEQVGFVAQEVQKIFPEAVTEADDGYLDFNIHAINIALVNAVKELKAENDLLKSRLEKIESMMGGMAEK